MITYSVYAQPAGRSKSAPSRVGTAPTAAAIPATAPLPARQLTLESLLTPPERTEYANGYDEGIADIFSGTVRVPSGPKHFRLGYLTAISQQ